MRHNSSFQFAVQSHTTKASSKMSFGYGSQNPNPSGMPGKGTFSFSSQARMSGGFHFTTGSSSKQGGNFQTARPSTRGLGSSSQGGVSWALEGSGLWVGSSFLESVPEYLRTDPEVLHMARLLRREEEKQRRLQEEINQKVEEAAKGYRGAAN